MWKHLYRLPSIIGVKLGLLDCLVGMVSLQFKIDCRENKHENLGKMNLEVMHQHKTSPNLSSPKKGQKKEDGWKEVMRK